MSDGASQYLMLPTCGMIITAPFSLTAILLVPSLSVSAIESIFGQKPLEFGTHQTIRMLANLLMSHLWPSLPPKVATVS